MSGPGDSADALSAGIDEESKRAAEEIAAEAESGGRQPKNLTAWLVSVLAIAWSCFQLYIAYIPLNSIIARSIHLTFAITMVYLAFPGTKTPGESWVQRISLQLFPGFLRPQRSTREVIPWYDYALAALAGMGALYMAWDYVNIIQRSGLPITRDVVVGTILVVLLLEAARRALGPALPILAMIFLLYCFVGPYMPSFIAHPGVPLEFVVDHMYLSDSGIWGVPIGVSTSFVFLFVLFGSLLDKAGAANYFVQVAFAALGRFRGGPAKAAVVASGMTGLVSGSSIANVATTGTFTIPLMKKVGLPPYKAGAVEVGASTNGQLMPPVMGAAAFIMAEFLGLAYLDIVRAAILPALLSYIALFYVVHLEALKLNLRPLREDELPSFWSTLISGIHYVVPILALIYTLVILRMSAVASAFNAILLTMAIIVVQRPMENTIFVLRDMKREKGVAHLRELFGEAHFKELEDRLWHGVLAGFGQSFGDVWQGMLAGAKNMMGIGVATAAAGIIVGTVTLTGLSGRFIELIEIVSLGNVVLMLVLTAICSLVLGMGLPTTANYIVMATLTAPVIVSLGGKAGLVVPLLAAHLFVFYFGILADDTPPVGLAAFAASAIAKSDPIQTGVQGFVYDLRTAVLPFVFIYNLELLMMQGVGPKGEIIWITDFLKIGWVCLVSLAAMFAFASALQGYFADICNWGERAILMVVCVSAFRPSLITDFTGGPRPVVQLIAVGIFAALYWYQRNRRLRRTPQPATA
ncbi:MAG: TRAP transporter permease [Nitrospinae bacterium]|nr:TRAP transporter permease [Nitrospinota bacterium]